MRNLAAALVAALLIAMPAWAQTKQPMFQSGRMVHSDLAKSVTQGVVETVGDLNGDALGMGANPFSVSDRKGLGLCFRTGAASAAHNVLCFGHDASENGLITLDSVNGLGDKKLYCRINGVLTECFGGTGGGGGGGGTGTVISAELSSPGGIFAVTGTNPIITTGTFGYTTTGTSGGVPYFSSASVVSASGELTANNPVIGGGTGAAPASGTRSGNTTQFATATGSKTANNCVKWDASGNVVDAGAPCSSGDSTPGCTEDAGSDGQVCNSTGGGGTEWGSRVIGALGASTIIAGGSSDSGTAPGLLSIYTQDADPASSSNGANIELTTGAGHTGGFAGNIIATTSQSPSGGSGGISLTTGISVTGGFGSGDLELRTGDNTAASNGVTGAITIQAGQPSHAANDDTSGIMHLYSWGGAAFGSRYRWQFLDFLGGTLSAPFYSGVTTYSAILHDGFFGGSAGAGAQRNFLIVGESYEGADSTPTSRNSGNVWLTGGNAGSSSKTPTYNSNHSGNLYLGAGYVYDTTKFDYGNIAFVSAQADQSYQVATSGGAVTVATRTGTLLLDGVSSTLTITLPRVPQDGRLLRIAAKGTVSSLTLAAPDGETISGAPSSLTNTGFVMMHRTANRTWYRVQ